MYIHAYIQYGYNCFYFYNYDFKFKSLCIYQKSLNLTDLERFVKFKISFCDNLNCEAEDGKIIKYFNFVGFYKEDLAVQIIERYWEKYRWNYLQNLAAWKYHPSKICFDV